MDFDAIVIGGGVVGMSAAWRLLDSGLKNVVVLERRLLGSGGTGIGTGSVHTQRWGQTDSALILRSKAMIQDVSKRSGGTFRFYPVGRLTVVGKHDIAAVQAYGQHLRSSGVDAVQLEPDEVADRFPLMNVADVGTALYTKDDGTVYPPALIWSLAGLFRNNGGTIWEGVGVARIVHDGDAVAGVEIANGDILRCSRVILAAGIWSKRILKASELSLALKHAVTHNTVVTVGNRDRWTEVPSLLDGIQGVIAIPRNPGTIMAANTAGEYGASRETADRVLDTTVAEVADGNGAFRDETAIQENAVLDQLRHRYSGYDIRGVSGHWAGLLDGTPDSHPLVGPYPGVEGLWVGCGLTGYGVQRGPGVGETLAALATGRPPHVDVGDYRLDRFDPDLDFTIDMSGDNPFAGFQAAGAQA